MQDCFFKGYSARHTSKLLDLDPKTVQKYFNKFLDDYKNTIHSESDNTKRAINYKIKTEIFLEERSDELLLLSDKLRPKLKSMKLTDKTFKNYKFLFDSILKINSNLANIQVLKANSYLTLSEAEFYSKPSGEFSN